MLVQSIVGKSSEKHDCDHICTQCVLKCLRSSNLSDGLSNIRLHFVAQLNMEVNDVTDNVKKDSIRASSSCLRWDLIALNLNEFFDKINFQCAWDDILAMDISVMNEIGRCMSLAVLKAVFYINRIDYRWSCGCTTFWRHGHFTVTWFPSWWTSRDSVQVISSDIGGQWGLR